MLIVKWQISMNFLEEHAASIFGVPVYPNIKGYFPEASNIHSGRRDNLKSHKVRLCPVTLWCNENI